MVASLRENIREALHGSDVSVHAPGAARNLLPYPAPAPGIGRSLSAR